jgi:hypothetical protein
VNETWTAITILFLYYNLHLSVMLDSLSGSFTSIFFLTTIVIMSQLLKISS